mmetsp:Transcript_29802/g.96200  ORF Transcript_29802/g.96200 Transcript_29802/m.96200 type:complete len:216 (+) Transcript_29802:148-795(+)
MTTPTSSCRRRPSAASFRSGRLGLPIGPRTWPASWTAWATTSGVGGPEPPSWPPAAGRCPPSASETCGTKWCLGWCGTSSRRWSTWRRTCSTRRCSSTTHRAGSTPPPSSARPPSSTTATASAGRSSHGCSTSTTTRCYAFSLRRSGCTGAAGSCGRRWCGCGRPWWSSSRPPSAATPASSSPSPAAWLPLLSLLVFTKSPVRSVLWCRRTGSTR